jgi:Flp pilus assembly protein TadD
MKSVPALLLDLIWPARRERAERRARAVAAIREALARGDAEGALRLARAVAREAGDDPDVARAVGEALARYGDREAGELFARAADAPADVTRALSLGSYLLSREEPELAAAVLSRAVELAPFDAVIRCELAVALARSGRPDEVVRTLVLHPDLAGDPGALFELGWASLLTFDAGSARSARDRLAELHTAPELLAKLDAALARSAVPPAREPPSARDYYFLEHGALLLDDDGPDRGRYEGVVLDAERAGRIVSLAARALAALEVDVGRVEAVGEGAEGVARALERALRRPRERERALALRVAAFAAQLEPSPGVLTFAVGLDPFRSAPLAPDLVGVMAGSVEWSGAEPEPPSDVDASELLAYASARRAFLPPSGGRVVTAFVPDAPR